MQTEELGPGVRQTQVQIPVLLLLGCVSLDTSLSPHLLIQYRDIVCPAS